MPWYIDKYLGDTTNLTTEQHGAYCLLLMSSWKKNGVLPNDDGQLATISHLPPAKWRASRAVLLEFFRPTDDGKSLTQKRLTKELEKAKAISEDRAKAGAEGAAKRWHKDGKPIANAKAKSSQDDAPSQNTSSLRSDSEANASVLKGRKAKPEKPEAHTTPTWNAYSNAYEKRYGVEPLRNAKVNGILAKFLALVPDDDGPEVAAFYVRHGQNLYVNSKHPVELLVRDAERLYTDWQTGSSGGTQAVVETAHHRQQRETHAELSGGRIAARTTQSTKPTTEVLDAIPANLLN